jgi:hypothetical protein
MFSELLAVGRERLSVGQQFAASEVASQIVHALRYHVSNADDDAVPARLGLVLMPEGPPGSRDV